MRFVVRKGRFMVVWMKVWVRFNGGIGFLDSEEDENFGGCC
jgi:hypothetical protein